MAWNNFIERYMYKKCDQEQAQSTWRRLKKFYYVSYIVLLPVSGRYLFRLIHFYGDRQMSLTYTPAVCRAMFKNKSIIECIFKAQKHQFLLMYPPPRYLPSPLSLSLSPRPPPHPPKIFSQI